MITKCLQLLQLQSQSLKSPYFSRMDLSIHFFCLIRFLQEDLKTGTTGSGRSSGSLSNSSSMESKESSPSLFAILSLVEVNQAIISLVILDQANKGWAGEARGPRNFCNLAFWALVVARGLLKRPSNFSSVVASLRLWLRLGQGQVSLASTLLVQETSHESLCHDSLILPAVTTRATGAVQAGFLGCWALLCGDQSGT